MLMRMGNLPVSTRTAPCLPQQGKRARLALDIIIELPDDVIFVIYSRYAKSFGCDNSIWIQEFSRVYFQMLKNGYSRLKKVR